VLLEELADVLTRPAASTRLAAIGRTAQQIMADYIEAIQLTEPLTESAGNARIVQ
jgi:hypothetical protein